MRYLGKGWITSICMSMFSAVFTALLFSAVALIYQRILNSVWGIFCLILGFLHFWVPSQIHSLILSFSNFLFYEVKKLLFNCITTKLHFQYFVELLCCKHVICELKFTRIVVFHLGCLDDFLGCVEYSEIIH